VPEYISTIKVKDVKKVKKLYPETWTKYIIRVDNYETKQLLPSVAKEITPILDALKIDYEVIEVPITLSGVCIAGHDYDIDGKDVPKKWAEWLFDKKLRSLCEISYHCLVDLNREYQLIK